MVTASTVPVAPGLAEAHVLQAGDGAPVVFLHGLAGQEWSSFLDELADRHQVFAPETPGVSAREDLTGFDGIGDLILYYDDLFDALGLDVFDLVGHGFGGMVAAEYAATFNRRVRKLVLLAPLGLWDDDHPVADHLLATGSERNHLFYGDLTAAEVAARLARPEDPQAAIVKRLDDIDSLAATAHFVHPVPERGLHRRLHRIRADSLIVWGERDALVPVKYASDFQAAIPCAQAELVDAGHHAHLERPEQVAKLALRLLDGPGK